MRRFSKLFAAASMMLAPPAVAQVDVTLPLDDDLRPELAVMGTIPIYWGESAGLGEMLAGKGEAHWARAAIERDWQLVPLDYLSADALYGRQNLLLAQPRGLSPEENVALDAWVRGGGRLLLFADPMMTGHSRFGLGDRRRPQDVALLSPILARWGLELVFDENGDDAGEHIFEGSVIPVNQPGHFIVPPMAEGPCNLASDGLIALCTIGNGTAMIVADAAILDLEGPYAGAEEAFDVLLSRILGMSGDSEPIPANLVRDTVPILGSEALSPYKDHLEEGKPR